MPDPKTSTSAPTRARLRAAGAPGPRELARRVRAAREAVGISAAEAARRLQVNQQTYLARESATSLPYGMLVEMIVVLGYDRAILCPELLGG